MPICTFDITPEGAAHSSTLDAPIPDGAYRWCHFDLSDPALPAFLTQHVPDIPAAALTAAETRPRCDIYGAGLMLNLRGINLNADGPADQMVAVRMWAVRNLMVTVRVRRVFALNDMHEAAKAGHAPPSPLHFITDLASRLMARVQTTVFELSTRVDEMEDSVHDDTLPLPFELAGQRRMSIRLRRYLGPQRDALSTLAALDHALLHDSLPGPLRELANQAKLAVEELDSLISRMTAVQDHHTAQAALKQGHNGYVLSIVAAVFLPLGFVTGLFGVNLGGMPGVAAPAAFALLCVGLVVLTVGAVWVMRKLDLI